MTSRPPAPDATRIAMDIPDELLGRLDALLARLPGRPARVGVIRDAIRREVDRLEREYPPEKTRR